MSIHELRKELANTLSSGLAGWLQLNISQRLGDLNGEDSAQLILAQILNASGRYLPRASEQPTNWTNDKKRVDIGLLPRNSPNGGWYGVVEAKWPGTSVDVKSVRKQCAQDAMRTTFVAVSNHCIRFFVLGGSTTALTNVFDKPHPQAADAEAQRIAFTTLFSRDLSSPSGELGGSDIATAFPEVGKRIPGAVFNGYGGKLKTKLLSRTDATLGDAAQGSVFVWQCARR